jgi:IMP dehydrogenase/GMP reductase
MHWCETEALTFDDVLLVPRYCDIESRKDVTTKTRLTKNIEIDIPIVTANMDTITEYKMAYKISHLGGAGIVHRFMSLEDMVKCLQKLHPLDRKKMFVSIGFNNNFEDYMKIYQEFEVGAICVDVAHGWCNRMSETIKRIKQIYPEVDVIAGNVATPTAVQDLIMAGADAVKVGIGPGCFEAGTRILMSNGFYKNIEDIQSGDFVINQNGQPVKVNKAWKTGQRTTCKLYHSKFYKPTGCTPDHRYLMSDYGNISQSTLSSKGYKKSFKDTKWSEIKDQTNEVLLLPKDISFNLPESFSVEIKKRSGGNFLSEESQKFETDFILENNWETGYIFGTFLGDGSSSVATYKCSTRGSVAWTFGANEEEIADTLSDCLLKITGKECSVTHEGSMIVVRFYSKPLADFLNNFGKKNNKHLPVELLVSDTAYIQGLLDGLIDSDGHFTRDGRICFDNTSPQLIELFGVCFYLLDGYFPNYESKGFCHSELVTAKNEAFRCRSLCNPEARSNDNWQFGKVLKRFDVKSRAPEGYELQTVDVYDIEVDCPTHSFIADNAVVHNSMCTTRLVTGCGVPQFTAIYECAEIAEEHNIPIIADGGITKSGDIVKALAAGASTVMVGSLIAGTDETPGKLIQDLVNKKHFKQYRGMASDDAMTGWKGEGYHAAPEGESKLIEHKGPVEPIINNLVAGLRSGMTYCNARNIEELQEHSVFRRVSRNSLTENRPHGI